MGKYFHNRVMFASIILIASLHTCQITIGKETMKVEIANSDEARTKGLMGRKHLAGGSGMLFVFDQPKILSFWMKNTEIPLSIAFFDERKLLIDLFDMPVPPSNRQLPIFQSSKPALYALEVPQNWFQDHGIYKGMEFSFLDQSNELE